MDAFGKLEHLRRHHALIHQKYRPFPCDVCNAKFGTKQNRSVHFKTRKHQIRVIATETVLNRLKNVTQTDVAMNSSLVREAVEQEALAMEEAAKALALAGAYSAINAAPRSNSAETPITVLSSESLVSSDGDAANPGKH